MYIYIYIGFVGSNFKIHLQNEELEEVNDFKFF